MKLTMKKIDSACIVAILAVSLSFGFFLAQKAFQERRAVRTADEAMQNTLRQLREAEADLQRLHLGLGGKKRELARLNERIPETVEMGPFLKQVDGMIRSRNVSLQGLQPSSQTKENYFSKMQVRLLLKGPFQNIYSLLHDLDKMDRLVKTEKLTMTRSVSDRACQADLVLAIYAQKG